MTTWKLEYFQGVDKASDVSTAFKNKFRVLHRLNLQQQGNRETSTRQQHNTIQYDTLKYNDARQGNTTQRNTTTSKLGLFFSHKR